MKFHCYYSRFLSKIKQYALTNVQPGRTVCLKVSKDMVRLHVKKGEESHFLYDTHVEACVEDVINDITIIYNGRLKISRICYGNVRSSLVSPRDLFE